jgi:hypothetical protein
MRRKPADATTDSVAGPAPTAALSEEDMLAINGVVGGAEGPEWCWSSSFHDLGSDDGVRDGSRG